MCYNEIEKERKMLSDILLSVLIFNAGWIVVGCSITLFSAFLSEKGKDSVR